MNERNTDDSDQQAQAIAEAMEKDPIGFAKSWNEMVRLSYMTSSEKPSMEAAELLHGAVQMGLRTNAPEVALDTLPLLLDVFSRAPDVLCARHGPTRRVRKRISEDWAIQGAARVLDTVVGVPRSLLARNMTARGRCSRTRGSTAATCASARSAGRSRRLIRPFVYGRQPKATTESTMHGGIEARLYSVAGVISLDCARRHAGIGASRWSRFGVSKGRKSPLEADALRL